MLILSHEDGILFREGGTRGLTARSGDQTGAGMLPCTHILFQDSFALKSIALVMLKVLSYR